MDKREILMKLKLRLTRGMNWLNYGQLLITVSIWVKLYFPGNSLVLVVAVGGALISLYMIGFVDEYWGIWKKESIYSTKNLNPYFVGMDKKLDKLLEIERKKKCL